LCYTSIWFNTFLQMTWTKSKIYLHKIVLEKFNSMYLLVRSIALSQESKYTVRLCVKTVYSSNHIAQKTHISLSLMFRLSTSKMYLKT